MANFQNRIADYHDATHCARVPFLTRPEDQSNLVKLTTILCTSLHTASRFLTCRSLERNHQSGIIFEPSLHIGRVTDLIG